MFAPQGFRLLALCAAAARLVSGAPPLRDYAEGLWAASFYRPREVHIQAAGIINRDTAFVATRSRVLALHDQVLTPVLEVTDAEITAFQLCHHRSSIFYEVASMDGGELSIFEYSLPTRGKVKVAQFQDVAAATSLACVDQLLLRASASALEAVHLQTGSAEVLLRYSDPAASGSITSLAVAYAADVVSRAEVFAVAQQNRSLLRLRLRADGEQLAASSEVLLAGGDGSDGPSGVASALEPSAVLWSRGQVIFADGCSVRVLHHNSTKTLLGSPGICTEPANETLEPVPWAAQLSRPVALAGEAQETAAGSVLVVTATEVLSVSPRSDECAGEREEQGCAAHAGCAWAEGSTAAGSGQGQRLCLACGLLTDWARSQSPPRELCGALQELRQGTRYSLAGCGCTPPSPEPQPTALPDGQRGGSVAGVLEVLFVGFIIVAAPVAAILLYRAFRRAAAMRELYADTAEFHTFNDDDGFH